jgi:uncharacterized protein
MNKSRRSPQMLIFATTMLVGLPSPSPARVRALISDPLAGRYSSKKAFIEGTFAKSERVLPEGAQLHVEHLFVKDNQAVVELRSLATAKTGMRFDNRYCSVVYLRDEVIVEVPAYLDAAMAMVTHLFEQNPIT